MKILMNTLWIGVIVFFIYLYILGSKTVPETNKYQSINNNNYNGQYNIPYSSSSSLCGELGYQFKMKHQREGYSKSNMMNKSNCKDLGDGVLEGYIYPSKKPNLRVFWLSKKGILAYRD